MTRVEPREPTLHPDPDRIDRLDDARKKIDSDRGDNDCQECKDSGEKGSSSHMPHLDQHKAENVLGLLIWAKVLISLGVVIAALFIAGFIYHFVQERKKAKAAGRSISWKKVFFGALTIAFFLWIPIWIVRKIKSFRGKSSFYAEIEEQQGFRPAATSETKPWNVRSAPVDEESRYEPMGYKPKMYGGDSSFPVSAPSIQASSVGGGTHSIVPSRSPSPLGHMPPSHDAGDLGYGASPAHPSAAYTGEAYSRK